MKYLHCYKGNNLANNDHIYNSDAYLIYVLNSFSLFMNTTYNWQRSSQPLPNFCIHQRHCYYNTCKYLSELRNSLYYYFYKFSNKDLCMVIYELIITNGNEKIYNLLITGNTDFPSQACVTMAMPKEIILVVMQNSITHTTLLTLLNLIKMTVKLRKVLLMAIKLCQWQSIVTLIMILLLVVKLN